MKRLFSYLGSHSEMSHWWFTVAFSTVFLYALYSFILNRELGTVGEPNSNIDEMKVNLYNERLTILEEPPTVLLTTNCFAFSGKGDTLIYFLADQDAFNRLSNFWTLTGGTVQRITLYQPETIETKQP